MKKKVLYGVFMALVAVFTMGSLQSCTDDLSDFKHQYVYDQYNLDQDIADLQKQINDNKAQCEAEIARLEALIKENQKENQVDIDELNDQLKELNGQIEKLVTAENLKKMLDELKQNLEKYASEANDKLKEELGKQIAGNLETMKALLGDYVTTDTFNSAIEKIEKDYKGYCDEKITEVLADLKVTNDALAAMDEELDELMNQIASIGGDVETIKTGITNMQNDIKSLKSQYEELGSSLDELWYYATETLPQYMTQMYNALNDDLQESKTELLDKIDYIDTQLEGLRSQLNNIVSRVDDLITSIMIQATDSPVFGNFSLPLGIQSNLLFNWYFKSIVSESYTFPSATLSYAYNAQEIKDGLATLGATEADVKTAIESKNSTYTVSEGYDDVNLGKIYMTINPVGHNVIDGKHFYLETSKGVDGRLPYTINVDESDAELTFGYSRSAENGFYEAEVIVPGSEDMINASKVDILSGLKSEAKDFLNDPTKRKALSLLKAVYDQLDNSFPQYALRAEWKNPDPTSRSYYSVLSKYDVAVATAQPLSFQFLDGKGIDRQLRTFGHIDNFFYSLKESGRLNFNFEGAIDVDKLHFNFDGLTIEIKDLPDTYIDQIKVEINADVISTDPENKYGEKIGEVVGTGEATAEDLASINEAIKKAIQDALDKAGVSMASQIGDSINGQIDTMVADVEKQVEDMINGKIDSVLGQLGDKAEPWFDRLNRLVDIYNRVANKINAFLKEPNQYLQPAMFYKNANGIGIVSQSKTDPTVFVNAGGSAFDLYATSYTAEIVAPAFKKMVACVNVIDNATGEYLSNGRELAKAFNNTSNDLARVLDGTRFGIVIPGSALQAGKTYEIMYQALDYSGFTSTRKFYIKVN